MVRNITGQGQLALSALVKKLGSSQDAAATSPKPQELLGSNKLFSDVEKHLDDVKKNKGYLSKSVSKEVSGRRLQSASSLADINPELSLLYNSFSTGLSYGANARFVSGISSSIKTTERLLDLYS